MLLHIISARGEKHKLEGPQLDNFIQEKMRSVITGETTNFAGDLEFTCSWIHEGKELCAERALLFCSTYHVASSISVPKVMKMTGSKFITSINHEKWEDDHVHTFTFAQTEEMIKDNIEGLVIVGNHQKLFYN